MAGLELRFRSHSKLPFPAFLSRVIAAPNTVPEQVGA